MRFMTHRTRPHSEPLPSSKQQAALSPVHHAAKSSNAGKMAQSYAVFIGLAIIIALCAVSWFAAPKGENQVLWRSSLILSIVSCYLMWAITFLAQLHPLIEPKRNNLREEFLGH
ncbi:hypothetical protein E4U54_004266 [Claviceps lovelessii]|nr:hypothetical protein E4U54_004266 [Claviceps lovelessii]